MHESASPYMLPHKADYKKTLAEMEEHPMQFGSYFKKFMFMH